MENRYSRVVVGEVLFIKKPRGGSTQMIIEVKINIIEEFMTRMSKLRKQELKLVGGKPTPEGQRHWIDPVKTKNDGK